MTTQLPTKEEWADFEAYVQRIEYRVLVLERIAGIRKQMQCTCNKE